MTSFCNEPEQPSRKTIVVERSVFAELVKAAEIGKLSSKVVGSFESERRTLNDKIKKLESEKIELEEKIRFRNIAMNVISGIAILFIYLFIWASKRKNGKD